MKYFTYMETIDNNPDRVLIMPADYDKFPFNTEHGGSYMLAPARVLGLSYAEYLRFIRASFPDDVSIEGKGKMIVQTYWRKGKTLYTFIDLLNAKLTLAMAEVENG